VLALLKNGKTVLENIGSSDDELNALKAIQDLGASCETNGSKLHIFSRGILPKSHYINCGESGLLFRMISFIAALAKEEMIIDGIGSLRKRSMAPLYKLLVAIGVDIKSDPGKLPLVLSGPIDPKSIDVRTLDSSQYLTGLLIAIAASADKQVQVTTSNLKSKPYVDLTLELLEHFGFKVTNHGYQLFLVEPVDKTEGVTHYSVESDWSSASFFLVAAAIAGELTLNGLNIRSKQADRAMLDALKLAGVAVEYSSDGLLIKRSDLACFDFDATDCPDLFPPLAVLAANAKGVSRISGAERLINKESNRGEVIQQEFGKMNVNVRVEGDIMEITGRDRIQGAAVTSHNDHRIAMALSILGLTADGATTIDDAEAIGKSYPAFFEHLASVGGSISLNN
jgi:3-phosphoshikimate 1-carboxyvinyltransferase